MIANNNIMMHQKFLITMQIFCPRSLSIFQNMTYSNSSEYLEIINRPNVNSPIATSCLCRHSVEIGSPLRIHSRIHSRESKLDI